MAIMELRTAIVKFCSYFHLLPTADTLTLGDVEALETMALTLQLEGGVHLHCLPRRRGTRWLM